MKEVAWWPRTWLFFLAEVSKSHTEPLKQLRIIILWVDKVHRHPCELPFQGGTNWCCWKFETCSFLVQVRVAEPSEQTTQKQNTWWTWQPCASSWKLYRYRGGSISVKCEGIRGTLDQQRREGGRKKITSQIAEPLNVQPCRTPKGWSRKEMMFIKNKSLEQGLNLSRS